MMTKNEAKAMLSPMMFSRLAVRKRRNVCEKFLIIVFMLACF